MEITAKTDDARWSAAMDNLVALMEEAGREATAAAGEAVRDATKAELVKSGWHSEFTYSPSPIGAGRPPAAVSGDLIASIESAMVTADTAWVGPTGLPYARIQELGGDMPVTRPGPMKYRKCGPNGLAWITREFVRLTARPYLRPGTEEVIDSGQLTEIYVEHWTAAIEEAG